MAKKATNSKETLYRVFVTHFSNEDQEQLVKLPLASPAREVKQRWSAEHGVPLRDLILRTMELQKIEDDVHLDAFAPSGSSIRAIALVMDEVTDIAVHLDDFPKHVKVSVCSPLSEFIPEVRRLFELEADRLIRFKVGRKILDSSSSLSAQEIDTSASLEVDLGFKIFLTEKSSDKTPAVISCFASDPLIPTLTHSSEVSLKFGGKEVTLSATVGEVFRGAAGGEQSLEISFPQKLFLVTNSGLQEEAVWPRQPLARVTDPKAEAMLDSRLLPRQLELCVLNFLSGLVITADVTKVSVRLSSGRIRVFRFSGQARLQDLFSKAAAAEGCPLLRLSCGGRRLDCPELRLRDCGLGSGSLVEVSRRSGLDLSVRTEPRGAPLRFEPPPDVTAVRFSQLVAFLRKAGCPQARGSVEFFCEGCRRRLCRQKESSQKVPSDCCDVRSLSLTTFETQGPDTANRKILKRLRHVACQNETRDSRVFCEIEVQTDFPIGVIQNPSEEIEVQTDFPIRVIQNPSEDKIISVGRELAADTTIWFRVCPPGSARQFGIRISSKAGDSFLDLIQRAADSSLGKLTSDTFTYVYQYGLYHSQDGRAKHALMNSFGAYIDLSGESVDLANMECSTQTPVFSTDDIVITPGWSPLLSVDINTRFFECGSGDDPVDLRQPLSCDHRILKDRRFVAWIEFRRVFRKDDPQLLLPYLMMDGIGVLDLNDGVVFDSIEEGFAQYGLQTEAVVVETCYLLLRHGSRLPSWRIPARSRFFINIREGADAALVGNVVKVENDRGGLNRWIYNRKSTSAFQEAVYDCMRAAPDNA